MSVGLGPERQSSGLSIIESTSSVSDGSGARPCSAAREHGAKQSVLEEVMLG
jgi:hypothetical protein